MIGLSTCSGETACDTTLEVDPSQCLVHVFFSISGLNDASPMDNLGSKESTVTLKSVSGGEFHLGEVHRHDSKSFHSRIDEVADRRTLERWHCLKIA